MKLLLQLMKLLLQFLRIRIYEITFTIFTNQNLWNYFYNFYESEFMKLLLQFLRIRIYEITFTTYENIFTIMKIFLRLWKYFHDLIYIK